MLYGGCGQPRPLATHIVLSLMHKETYWSPPGPLAAVPVPQQPDKPPTSRH